LAFDLQIRQVDHRLQQFASVAFLKFDVPNRQVDAGCLDFGRSLGIRPVLRGTVGGEQRAERFSHEPIFASITVLGIRRGIRGMSEEHLYEFRTG
jgi:hypothetical protein